METHLSRRVSLDAGWPQGGDIMGGALCVLQAGDLRLDEPIAAIADLPTALRDVAIQSRQLAAARLFQQALDISADLVLLTGPLADFSREPRLACWLSERFAELQRAGTAVVWAQAAPAEFLIADQFPANVRILAPQQSIAFPFARRSQAVELHWNRGQTLIERSSRSCDLVIALHTQADGVDVEYFTRGIGETSRQPSFPLQRGGPQLGSSSGFWRVECPALARPQAELLPAATVAWQTVEVELAAADTEKSLRQALEARFRTLRAHAAAELTVVTLQVSGDAIACARWLQPEQRSSLLHDLRCSEFASGSAALWCADLELAPVPGAFATWGTSQPVSIGLREYDRILREDSAGELPQNWKPHATWTSEISRRRAMKDLKLRVVSELTQWTDESRN